MKRQIKVESRIAFVSIVRVRKKNIMNMIIYRAGYIEDIEIHRLKAIEDTFIHIKSSRHAKQIRYVVFHIDPLKLMNYPLESFPFPLIITYNEHVKLKGLEESEYNILKKRGFIDDGLNISKIISNLIKNYDKVLPKVWQSTKA